MPFASRRADLLERSLEGFPSTDREVQGLVATARRIPALTSSASAPHDEFVSALGRRLRAEGLALAASADRRASSPSKVTMTGGHKTAPLVIAIGRGMRVAVGATASLLLIGALVGVSSRSALPGGLLYPMKQVLNSAAVQLSGSDFNRGVTLLSQARTDLRDARALVERDRAMAHPVLVNQALLSAYDSARTGQRALLGDFDRTRNTQALITLQDFTASAMPQLNALRPQVPATSRPDVDSLIALLRQTRAMLAHTVALCGAPCDLIGDVNLGGRHSPEPPAVSSLVPPHGSLRIPGLPTGGLPILGPAPAITGPGGVVVGPAAPPLPISGGATVPPVTVGSLTVTPPPIVVPPLPPLSSPIQTTPLPTGLP